MYHYKELLYEHSLHRLSSVGFITRQTVDAPSTCNYSDILKYLSNFFIIFADIRVF